MSVQYRPDPRGMRELATSSGVREVVAERAERGVEWMQANAPVDSGEYRDSFEIEQQDLRMFGSVRACASIYNSAPHATEVDRQYGLFPRAVDIIEAD